MKDRIGMRDELLLVALIVLAVAGFTLARPAFLSLGNILNIGQQSAIVAIVAFGMTAVIIARGIDISVGGTMAAAGIVSALVLNATGSGFLALLAAVGTGAGFGLINAGLVAALGISSFVATLGTMALARGTSLSLSSASSIPVADAAVLWAGQAEVLAIPAGLVVAIAICLAWKFLLERTIIGRWIYATGGNEHASRASLVPVKRVQAFTYVMCGASAGISAIIGIGRLGSAQPLAGNGLEFAAITAAVVGGASLSGGKGSVTGTMLGAIAIGVINTGLSFLQVSQQYIYMVSGILILVAVLARGGVPWAGESLGRMFARSTVPAPSGSGGPTSLTIDGISKSFGSAKVLHDISFAIGSGEVVALMGENGAGKSTLVKCLSGVHEPDTGTIAFLGGSARSKRIAVIHQHFSLVPDLSIAESLSLGREPSRFAFLRRAEMRLRAAAALREVGLDCSADTPVRMLTVGERQMLEIAKALMAGAWLVVMDEPTSALSNRERDQLYTIVRKLTARGCAVLYISHKMEEVRELATRTVVLRDGRLVADRRLAELSEKDLVHLMVGRDIGNVFPWVQADVGDRMLAVGELATGGLLRGVTLDVRAGEVVGLAGLMGSGRSDILRCIAGLEAVTSGSIDVRGHRLASGDQASAARLGIAFVPEDRHREGIVAGLSIADNLGLVWMRRQATSGVVSRSKLRGKAAEMIRRLDIRPPEPAKATGNLSGGNQQKVVIGKWLAVDPTIMLLDEPTSGVDVGAKSEIHKVIGELKAAGAAILLVSSELPELLGVSDRIFVVREGRTVGEFARGVTEEQVMEAAFGTVDPVRAPELEDVA